MKNYTLGSVVRAMSWGALLGGAAGFALGLLVAPEEGRRTRRRLSYRLESLGQQVSDFADQMLHRVSESGDARRSGDAVVADAQVRAERIRSDIEALLGEVRQYGGPSRPSMN